MEFAKKRRLARTVLPGLLAGGLCGLGIGLELVPFPVGLAASVLVAAGVGLAVRRQKAALRPQARPLGPGQEEKGTPARSPSNPPGARPHDD
jgi:hypothetical protein